MHRLRAPFSLAQIFSINEFQQSGRFRPFECAYRDAHPGRTSTLVAYRFGMACPSCTYEQEWVYPLMADWSWRKTQDDLIRLRM